MIDFYQVSSAWIYSKTLNRIQQRYGLVSMGYYWKVIDKIMAMDGRCPKPNLMVLRDGGLRWKDAASILMDFDLFLFDQDGFIHINPDNPDTGVRLPPKVASRTRAMCACATSACATDADATPVRASDAYATPEPSIEFKEKEIREEESAKQNFSEFMEKECPHLLLFEEPMTFEDLKVLRKTYTIDEVKSVLLAMENKVGLECTYRSCTETAIKWLEKRCKK